MLPAEVNGPEVDQGGLEKANPFSRDQWFESISLQRRVRCEPIFPPGPKAGPKTRGGAHEPLTQIKQFLSAAHHLLSK